MSNTNPTTPIERVSIPAILADLILLQSRAGLPMPIDIYARSEGPSADLAVESLADVRAWQVALGAEESAFHTSTYPDRGPIHSTYVSDRLGWYVRVTASIRDLPATSLPDETLAELEQIVAGTPDVPRVAEVPA
jgi:hypothetical protein